MKPWQLKRSWFWDEAPFFRLLVPVIPAIVLYDHYGSVPGSISFLFPVSLLVVLVSAFLFAWVRAPRFIKMLSAALLQICIFTLTLFVCVESDLRYQPKWFGHAVTTAQAFEARLLLPPALKSRTWKLSVSLEAAYDKGTVKAVTGKAFVYVYRNGASLPLKQGDKVILPNEWVRITNAGNPNEFDFARFCARNGIYYQQFISADKIAPVASELPPLSFTERLHARAMSALETYVKDSAALGMLQAMLLGEQVNLDPALRQAYAQTGIVHIIAISGAHVSVLFFLVALLLFWLRSPRWQLIKYLFALPVVYLYVAVAGAPISAIRAAVMFSLIVLSMAAGKTRHPLNHLFATAFFMLIFRPMWLFSIGFQLSFTAVLGLTLFYKSISRWYTPTPILLRKLWEAVAASVAVEVLVAPLVVYYFHLFPLYFIAANIVAYTLMSLLLVSGLLLIFLSPFSGLATIISHFITSLVNGFNAVVFVMEEHSPAVLGRLFISFPQLLLCLVAIAFFARFFYTRKWPLLAGGLAFTVLLFLSLGSVRWQRSQQQQLVAYNVSHGSFVAMINGTTMYAIEQNAEDKQSLRYATAEHRLAKGNRKLVRWSGLPVFRLRGGTVLVLQQPLQADPIAPFAVDHLILTYPISKLDAVSLLQQFRFKKLIVTGNQSRTACLRLKDSCTVQKIPAHFTLLDGAFVLE